MKEQMWSGVVCARDTGDRETGRQGAYRLVIVRMAVALVLVGVGSFAFAQSGLRLENQRSVGAPRSGGPLYVTGELQSDRPDLVEGRLRFILRGGVETLAVVETDPIVLVSGNLTRFRQLLPVPEGQLGDGVSTVSVEFATDDTSFALGDIPVPFANSRQNRWQTVVLSVEPSPNAGLGTAERLQNEILFERSMADPVAAARDGEQYGISTSRAVLAASDLPEQSLAYCAFDLVVVPGDALVRLTARQGTALADWVRAGGAICLVADRPLERKQVAILDELFRDSSTGPFVRDDEGRLLEPDGAAGGILARRAGLGFATVIFEPLDAFDFASPEWREAHARLWKLREEYVALRREDKPIGPPGWQTPREAYSQRTVIINGQRVVETMVVPGPSGIAPGMGGYPNAALGPMSDPSHPRSWTFPPSHTGTAIVAALRPESIRLLPGWIVVLILFGYVVLVGPLDFLVLGKLRLRKWTWLTFPAATLGVTWGVVGTANAFMSDNDHVRSVSIVDLDAHGEPVRRTRLDLHFRGATAPVVHEIDGAYFTSLDATHFANEYTQNPIVVNGRIVASEARGTMQNDAPTGPYVGTIASRYVVPQQIAKWTPQVNRTFEIAPAVNVPKIDWAKLEEPGQTLPVITLPGGVTGYVERYGLYGFGREGAVASVVQGTASLLGAAETAPFPSGRLTLVYQRSPLGLGRLDDLPFVDAMAEGLDAVLVWSYDADRNITIYRKPVGKDRSR